MMFDDNKMNGKQLYSNIWDVRQKFFFFQKPC